MRLGLTLPAGTLSARDSVDLAVSARGLGYGEFWLAEVGSFDSYAVAGALAQAVPGARIGTAVVPAQTRTPMVHAMAAAALSQLTDGRFVLGIGISSENIVRDWAGLPFDRPLRRMREHVEVLRRALAGEKVDFDGETLSVHKFRLQARVTRPVPIYMGALNAGMLRLAGRLADGIVLNMVPERALGQVLGEVRAGAESAGRDPATIEVVARLHTVMTDDVGAGHNLVRAGFGAYAATSVYNRFFRWIGFGAEAAAIADGYARGDRKAVAAAMSSDMCDAIALVGDAGVLRERLRAYARGGVDVCILNPLTPDPAGPRAQVETLADALDGMGSDGPLGVLRATT